MRVLHYEPAIRLELGGVVRAVLDIAAEQAKAGANVTLVTHDAKTCHLISLEQSRSFRAQGFLAGLAPAPLTARSLCQQNDVIHLHGAWSLANLQWAEIAVQSGCAYFLSPHGMLDDWCMEQKSLKKKNLPAFRCPQMA